MLSHHPTYPSAPSLCRNQLGSSANVHLKEKLFRAFQIGENACSVPCDAPAKVLGNVSFATLDDVHHVNQREKRIVRLVLSRVHLKIVYAFSLPATLGLIP